ncbi:DMT family transporter [Albidovulum sp.]|uniref:DMT family transporter n=1 Tax=Albidovulum sp. TaxID=1872424 RepID=UPI001D74925F|nr:DMT family transporter [Paracoccaceae bacterium]MCC0046815.1 DMT family transporter [Defluviimonas sp.]HPE25459.1 DMT family transporter [Albidovulum sp.]MCB2120153.1 DMT family transporter [Paracoccaceae bacterium]MCB2121298.1 DMT family transporter [Paracoccaceae bacterium]
MSNLRGIALVLFAMAAFSVEDALIKALTESLPIGQVLMIVGVSGTLVFMIAAGDGGRAATVRAALVPSVLLRTLSEGVGALTFVTALSLLPLSTVAAVFQATPLAVTAGAALFMGERVGWRRWLAVVAGFVGVLMIIRPGAEGFQAEALLVVVTVVVIAARDLITRRIPPHVASVAVSCHGFFAVAVSGAALIALGDRPVMPDGSALWKIGFVVLCSTTGYYAIVAAMRMAEASALMPFRYARLVLSLAIAVVVFAEHPDAMTLAGAAVILCAAFYTYLRERKIALTSQAA